MPNIEIHGCEKEEATIIRDVLLEYLLRKPRLSKDYVITIVIDRCIEAVHTKDAPFLRIFVTQDDDVTTVLKTVNSCPLKINRTHDIEVVQLHAFYPRKK